MYEMPLLCLMPDKCMQNLEQIKQTEERLSHIVLPENIGFAAEIKAALGFHMECSHGFQTVHRRAGMVNLSH